VVARWLNVYYIDALYAERLNNVTAQQGEYFQRRQEGAHRLYLSAIRTLAQVRRLLSTRSTGEYWRSAAECRECVNQRPED
jgi:hypothetical protein